MSEKNRSLRTKPPLTPKIGTRGNSAFKKQTLSILPQTRSKLTIRWNNISLHWSFPSTRSSTLSRISCGLGVRDQSDTTPHFPERKNIAPTMIARDTRPSIAKPFGSIWKNSSNKISSKSTSSLPKQLPNSDNLMSIAYPATTHVHPIQSDVGPEAFLSSFDDD